MPKTTLTSRERVNRMFARQDHDRVPRHDTFWDETIDRFRREGGIRDVNDVLDRLGNDFTPLSWSDPSPFPGRRDVITEDEQTVTYIGRFGETARWWKHRSGTPEHIAFDCDSPTRWYETYAPALQAAGISTDVEGAQRREAEARRHDRWTHICGLEPFEGSRAIMGDEVALMAMATDPQWIADFSRLYTDMILRDWQAVLDAGVKPDGAWVYGDMAYNHGTLCSPDMYRELIWPDHRRMVEFAHAHGMKFIYHSDGDVRGVIDLYIEAGFDCLQPLESKAQMDVRRLTPTYADRLALFGNIDVMVMGTNDRDRVEQEIREKVTAARAGGAYAYHSDHSVPPSVNWSTYQFIIELLDRYGNYD